jgi:hypothetical protein
MKHRPTQPNRFPGLSVPCIVARQQQKARVFDGTGGEDDYFSARAELISRPRDNRGLDHLPATVTHF